MVIADVDALKIATRIQSAADDAYAEDNTRLIGVVDAKVTKTLSFTNAPVTEQSSDVVVVARYVEVVVAAV